MVLVLLFFLRLRVIGLHIPSLSHYLTLRLSHMQRMSPSLSYHQN
jgi:hypothetical protein